jgi:diketogulonate reductase-like aldo/keto reductase
MLKVGTYKITGHDLCYEVINNALQIGYRLFDTEIT